MKRLLIFHILILSILKNSLTDNVEGSVLCTIKFGCFSKSFGGSLLGWLINFQPQNPVEIKTNFHIFTDSSNFIVSGLFNDDEITKLSIFNKNAEVYFIVHNFDESYRTGWVRETIRLLLLKQKDMQLIVVDWSHATSYLKAVANSRLVAKQMAYLVEKMPEKPKKIRIIGSGLGAQLAGLFSYEVTNNYNIKIIPASIIAINPDYMLFDHNVLSDRLDVSDSSHTTTIISYKPFFGYKIFKSMAYDSFLKSTSIDTVIINDGNTQPLCSLWHYVPFMSPSKDINEHGNHVLHYDFDPKHTSGTEKKDDDDHHLEDLDNHGHIDNKEHKDHYEHWKHHENDDDEYIEDDDDEVEDDAWENEGHPPPHRKPGNVPENSVHLKKVLKARLNDNIYHCTNQMAYDVVLNSILHCPFVAYKTDEIDYIKNGDLFINSIHNEQMLHFEIIPQHSNSKKSTAIYHLLTSTEKPYCSYNLGIVITFEDNIRFLNLIDARITDGFDREHFLGDKIILLNYKNTLVLVESYNFKINEIKKISVFVEGAALSRIKNVMAVQPGLNTWKAASSTFNSNSYEFIMVKL
uniref:Endothelial lipase n=1 Tax=Tetracapsuloides bryosalmonae TaxID=271932 RepID=A0A859IQB4_9CNID|nr:endothelial lipase [Tetracapsuloides bryosalmonae]